MLPFLTILLAQSEVQAAQGVPALQLPRTGNERLDGLINAIYAVAGIVGALGALFGFDKIKFWAHQKKSGGGSGGMFGLLSSLVTSQTEMAKTMDQMSETLKEQTEKLHQIQLDLAELSGRMR